MIKYVVFPQKIIKSLVFMYCIWAHEESGQVKTSTIAKKWITSFNFNAPLFYVGAFFYADNVNFYYIEKEVNKLI